MSGDLTVALGRRCYQCIVGRGLGCCKTYHNAQDRPHNKEHSSLKSQKCWGWETLLSGQSIEVNCCVKEYDHIQLYKISHFFFQKVITLNLFFFTVYKNFHCVIFSQTPGTLIFGIKCYPTLVLICISLIPKKGAFFHHVCLCVLSFLSVEIHVLVHDI